MTLAFAYLLLQHPAQEQVISVMAGYGAWRWPMLRPLRLQPGWFSGGSGGQVDAEVVRSDRPGCMSTPSVRSMYGFQSAPLLSTPFQSTQSTPSTPLLSSPLQSISVLHRSINRYSSDMYVPCMQAWIASIPNTRDLGVCVRTRVCDLDVCMEEGGGGGRG